MRTMSRLVRSEVSIASSSDNTGFINYSHKNLFLAEASHPQQTQLNCIYFKVSVKENEVPTEKNSSRASIFASYISN